MFCIKIPRRQDDERNNIYLELMKYDNTEKYPFLLGSVQVHLYEVIQVCIKVIFSPWYHIVQLVFVIIYLYLMSSLWFIIYLQTHVLRKQYLPWAIFKKTKEFVTA